MKKKRGFNLEYNKNVWTEALVNPINTLQVFITNNCNMRCKACFYAHNLGKEEICFEEYKNAIRNYRKEIGKVILLGGEPTLYKDLNKIIRYNTEQGLRTTVYTNGSNVKSLEKSDLSKTTIRIGVYGAKLSEKPLAKVPETDLPVTIVYMLRKNNTKELMEAARMTEKRFNCERFYVSSIRDITETQDYWKDTDETLTMEKYFEVVQEFIRNYKGNLKEIHIARRGVIRTTKEYIPTKKCRFGNLFPDGKKIICPLDISKKSYVKELRFDKKICNKNKECILQKIVLRNLLFSL